jgi:hypothetical protein
MPESSSSSSYSSSEAPDAPALNPLDIVSTAPVVVPLVPEKVYALWRISGINIVWDNPAGAMPVETFFRNARRPDPNGFLEDGPVRTNYHIANLWDHAGDPEVAQVIYLLTKLLERKAKENNVIS